MLFTFEITAVKIEGPKIQERLVSVQAKTQARALRIASKGLSSKEYIASCKPVFRNEQQKMLYELNRQCKQAVVPNKVKEV